jgi:hypothetical protein
VTTIDGGFRSILLPVIGPAVTQLFARSQSCCEFVEALAVSVFVATDVAKKKGSETPGPAGAGVAIPEVASLALQLNVKSALCQKPSAMLGLQLNVGGVLSTTI